MKKPAKSTSNFQRVKLIKQTKMKLIKVFNKGTQ